MPRIRDLAQVCKSKNAGPFELTIDVVFDDRATFEKVRHPVAVNQAVHRSTGGRVERRRLS